MNQYPFFIFFNIHLFFFMKETINMVDSKSKALFSSINPLFLLIKKIFYSFYTASGCLLEYLPKKLQNLVAFFHHNTDEYRNRLNEYQSEPNGWVVIGHSALMADAKQPKGNT